MRSRNDVDLSFVLDRRGRLSLQQCAIRSRIVHTNTPTNQNLFTFVTGRRGRRPLRSLQIVIYQFVAVFLLYGYHFATKHLYHCRGRRPRRPVLNTNYLPDKSKFEIADSHGEPLRNLREH